MPDFPLNHSQNAPPPPGATPAAEQKPPPGMGTAGHQIPAAGSSGMTLLANSPSLASRRGEGVFSVVANV